MRPAPRAINRCIFAVGKTKRSSASAMVLAVSSREVRSKSSKRARLASIESSFPQRRGQTAVARTLRRMS